MFWNSGKSEQSVHVSGRDWGGQAGTRGSWGARESPEQVLSVIVL